MRKFFNQLKNSFISGLLFLLPVFIVLALLTKVFQFFSGFSAKIASLFGLSKIAGLSGGTIVSVIGFILLTIICGFFIRVAFMKQARDWLDRTLVEYIPGYRAYKDLAETKIKGVEGKPAQFIAAIYDDGTHESPCLLAISERTDKASLFFPATEAGGKSEIRIVPFQRIKKFDSINVGAWEGAIKKGGVGLLELIP